MKIKLKPKPAGGSAVKGKPAVKGKVATKAAPPAKKGGTVFDKARRIGVENQRLADIRKNQPFRFRMKVGEERKIILTDRATDPEKLFALYEHHYETRGGKWNGFASCIKDSGPCPACDALEKEGRYLLMLSCIDLTSYTDKDGKVIKSSRKLLPVPQSMIGKYERIFKQHGTFRGLVLELHRDGDKSPGIGDDVHVIKKLAEADLAKYKDKAEPVDYRKAFPPMSYADLKKQFPGGGKIAGAEEFDDSEGGEAEELDDEIPF